MCGIIGYVGNEEAPKVLIDSLKRLEYRGYDSAGIAVANGATTELRRAEGKIDKLELLVQDDPIKGNAGIGHTRWATHGKPSEMNAHPHRSGSVTVVHNGIVENHNELKEFLLTKDYEFKSETDTEVVCHLIDYYLKTDGEMILAIRKALKRIRGSYAFVIMNAKEPGKLYIARHGSPLVTGTNSGKSYVASDVPAILPYTREMTFLEDGDIGVIQEGEITLYSGSGEKIARKAEHIPWSPLMAERGGYKHFMLKEIFEQPNVFEDAIAGRAFVEHGKVQLDALSEICAADSFSYDEIVIIACGTSLYAGMVGKYLIESLAGVRVTVELASEFRYRNPIINKRMLVVPISQSGETADTLAALQMMKKSGVKILSICNVIGSTMTREADATIHTHAGPEIGVASTKAFTTQLTVLLLLALDISGRRKHLKKAELTKMLTELLLVPRQMQKILEQAPSIQKIAEKYAHVNNALFIGRGPSFPVALEGALKLKEISYIHAEGFAAGELKHGPIALIESGVPVIAIALNDEVYEKMLANIEEVKARGAEVIAIVTAGNTAIREKVDHVIELPATSVQLAPLLVTIPLQLLAYFVADHKGTDVDQPRNLAKSVTVE